MTNVGRLGVVVCLLALVPACGDGGVADPQESTILRVIEGTVERAADGAGFQPVGDEAALGPGDTVRTGADGRAAIEWFDGSPTRLDRIEDADGDTTLAHAPDPG